MMQKTGTRTITTPRLILRRFRLEDAGDMYRNWASDAEVTRYLTWPPHQSAEVSGMLLGQWTAQYEDGGYFNWAIQYKENGEVIGNISVVRLDEAIDSAEIGYCLSRTYWGRGLMPEALRAVTAYLFDTVGLNRVWAGHDVENPKSGRVMEKSGMKPEGILRAFGRNNRGICDMAVYSILRDERAAVPRGETSEVSVRFAREEDLIRINELRRQVNELHVAGKPEVFKPGFPDELRDYVRVIFADDRKKIVVAELDGTVAGFAVLNHITRPENPFMYIRDFLDVDEFGVDEKKRRRGAAAAMIRFIRDYAREQGFGRIELNMWEFNRGALAFYETAGFETYRRYMEMKL
ncbi:MAG: GNAT family N-acetyltransferase [Clostridia bacterium]|nr:GNAT family N-acetyltransferase [Clostridia bacterium]